MFRFMTMLHSGHRRNPCVRFRTKALTLCIVLSVCEHARPQQFSTTTQKDIAQERHMIDLAEREHLPDAQIGYLWSRLASDYVRGKPTSRARKTLISVRFVCSGTHPKRRKAMRPCSTTSAFFTSRTIAGPKPSNI